MKGIAPDATETISYAIPTFDLHGKHLVHFAGYDYANPRPLVLDARVYRAAQEVAPTAPVPNPARRTTGEQYRAYCAWAGEIAERNAVDPELVEYALFIRGAS